MSSMRRLRSVLGEPYVRNSLLIWGCCAFIFSLAAALLTLAVVHVSSESDSDIEVIAPYLPVDLINATGAYAPPVTRGVKRAEPPAERDREFYESGPSPQLEEQSTPYGNLNLLRKHALSGQLFAYQEQGRNAQIMLHFPRGFEQRFVINHLTGFGACHIEDSGDTTNVTVSTVSASGAAGSDMWLVTLKPARLTDPLSSSVDTDGPEYRISPNVAYGEISCSIRPRIEWETFASQRLSFAFVAVPPDLRGSVGLADFVPADDLNVDLSGIEGAQGISYNGGLASDKMFAIIASPEYVRSVPADSSFEATWEIVSRAQLRDAILVVVGSLIALAAAMVVEALRPVFEHMLEAEPASASKSETSVSDDRSETPA